jgi:NAD(P)-dependent dehydrogenase (short-subunit alcohol dehydrogenase family)
MTFKEKVIVITGAASGIGRATAVGLAEKGVAGLALCDLDELNLKGTQALCKSAI